MSEQEKKYTVRVLRVIADVIEEKMRDVQMTNIELAQDHVVVKSLCDDSFMNTGRQRIVLTIDVIDGGLGISEIHAGIGRLG